MATPITKAASQASGSAFGFIANLFNQANNLVTAVGAGADMLNDFVDKAHTKQKAQDAAEMAEFWQDLMQESAIERSRKQAELNAELSQKGEVFRELYADNLKLFRGALQKAAQSMNKDVDLS